MPPRPAGMSAADFRRMNAAANRTERRIARESKAARDKANGIGPARRGLTARLGIRTIPGRLSSPTRASASAGRTSGS